MKLKDKVLFLVTITILVYIVLIFSNMVELDKEEISFSPREDEPECVPSRICLDSSRIEISESDCSHVNITCPSDRTCMYGECVVFCQDQDLGFDIFNSSSVTLETSSLRDICLSQSSVREGLCRDNGLIVVESGCPQGSSCFDGACSPVGSIQCGNGIIEAGEQCDDGCSFNYPSGCDIYPLTNGDLCSSLCQLEQSLSFCSQQGSDYDSDYLCDVWELMYGLNPSSLDSNVNGFPDGDEDPDLDLYSNYQEYLSNTDPLNPDSKPPQQPLPRIVSYWGSYLDGNLTNASAWSNYLEINSDLRDIGFTHAGIRIWSEESLDYIDSLLLSQGLPTRLEELDSLEFNLMLSYGGGRYLEDPLISDPDIHESNGQNIKYFDSTSFDAYDCSSCERDCSIEPRKEAHDPIYSGQVWQNELELLGGIVRAAEFQENDVIMIDQETYGPDISAVTGCYPEALEYASERYPNEFENERHASYFNNVRERFVDIKSIINQNNQISKVLAYNDQIPAVAIDKGYSVPPGVLDLKSAPMYRLPNLNTLKLDLGITCNNNYEVFKCSKAAQKDYSQVYIWISITDFKVNGNYRRLPMDPKVLQKAGYYLNQENVPGVIFWPGVENLHPSGQFIYDRPFYDSAERFMIGYNGEDKVLPIYDYCGDDLDNDGSYVCDENETINGVKVVCNIPRDCDGLPYTWELQYGLNPENVDSDNDRLEDPWEDPDEDLILNYYEYQNGTDPLISNLPPVCGNMNVETGEFCDDGNTINNDGCSADCLHYCLDFDYGLNVSVSSNIDVDPANGPPNTVFDSDVCLNSTRLREGICLYGEMSLINIPCYNGCSNGHCIAPYSYCGDGFVNGNEQCDDGCLQGIPNYCESVDSGNGCSSNCLIESVSPPSNSGGGCSSSNGIFGRLARAITRRDCTIV